MDSNYESFKQKILKLNQLAERGEEGEAMNARKAMERLCNSMGVKLEDILSEVQTEQNYVFSVRNDNLLRILFWICADKSGISRKSIGIVDKCHYSARITPLQYAELFSLWSWHKANFTKELENLRENLLVAYLYKHNLSIRRDKEDEEESVDEEDMEQARKSLGLLKLLDDATYVKGISK